MNYKIVVTSEEFSDVLLHRFMDEDTHAVQIKAIGCIMGAEDMFAEEEIFFDNAKSASGFIRDYSVESANEWCAEFGITSKISVIENITKKSSNAKT